MPSWALTVLARARWRRLLAGKPDYDVTDGNVRYKGEKLLEMEADERSRAGNISSAFNTLSKFPASAMFTLLKAALNARRKERGEEEIDSVAFMRFVREKAKLMQFDQAFSVPRR